MDKTLNYLNQKFWKGSKQEVSMRKAFVAAVLAGVVIVIAGISFAASTYDPAIHDRIADQQKPIDQGIASGALTRSDADILQDNLNWIKGEEARLKRDGRLTKHERDRLHKMLDRNSNMINKKKHNPARRLY